MTENGEGGNTPSSSSPSDFLLDLDALAPPKRITKVGGEEIDVSILSVKVALKFVEFQQKFNFTEDSKAEDFKPEILLDMAEILGLVCEKSSKKITADWLINNLDMSAFMAFMKFALNPMMKSVEKAKTELSKSDEGEPGKN